MSNATVAKLLLLALSFCWGLSWSAMRIALDEVSPWSMRLIGYSIGAATLLVLIKAQGRSLVIPSGRDRWHVFVAALFIVVAFGIAGTFAQLMANTSRVIIVNYSMPVWGSLMAYFVLRERIDRAPPSALRCASPDSACWSSGRGAVAARADRPAARAGLRAGLGRRHGLYEMGAHQGRPAGDHVLAGRGRRGGVRDRSI